MSDNKHDIDGLLRKNGELLSEVKGLKAKLGEIEAERDTARSDADAAQAMTRSVSLERPLEAALGSAFVAPWRIVRPLLDEHFTFGLSDDGNAVVTMGNGEGETVSLAEIGSSLSTIPELAAMLRPPKGGGATGSAGGTSGHNPEKEPRKVASPFGLR